MLAGHLTDLRERVPVAEREAAFSVVRIEDQRRAPDDLLERCLRPREHTARLAIAHQEVPHQSETDRDAEDGDDMRDVDPVSGVPPELEVDHLVECET